VTYTFRVQQHLQLRTELHTQRAGQLAVISTDGTLRLVLLNSIGTDLDKLTVGQLASILLRPKVNYRAHMSPPLDTILNPVHYSPPSHRMLNVNIIWPPFCFFNSTEELNKTAHRLL
jgi:hypothetical protein